MHAFRAGLLLGLLPVLGCVESGVQTCGDLVCASDKICSPYLDDCVRPEHILCGNGVVDVDHGEVCDIRDPALEQDPDRQCSTDCRSDLRCGNFIVDIDQGEECDCGPSPADDPQGGMSGASASGECAGSEGNDDARGYCKSDCTLHCGDGDIRGDEQCEGDDLGNMTCVAMGFDTGVLGCTQGCGFDTAGCRRIGWYPADPSGGDTTAGIRAIWGSPEGTVFAVGNNGKFARRVAGEWVSVPGPVIDADLLDVWGTSDSNVYAVGEDGTIVHFDGITRTVTSVGNERLVAVWGANVLLVYAVSQSGAVYRSNSAQPDPSKPDQAEQWIRHDGIAPDQARDVWGLGPDDVYIVSTTGRLYRYDGERVAQDSGLGGLYVQAVWGAGDTLFAVGNSGLIRRRQGQSWVAQDTATSARLLSVWGSGPNDVFAAGEDGVALRYDGAGWRVLNTVPAGVSRTVHTPQRFGHGWSMGPDEVFAVDHNDGRVWRYHGMEWGVAGTGLGPGNVRGMWGQGPGVVYAVTADSAVRGGVWRYDGASWSLVTEAGAPLHAMAGAASGELYAVGARGTVLHHDGVAWRDLSVTVDAAGVWDSSPAPDLDAVWASDDGHVFIGGASGTIIHRDPVTGLWTGMASSAGADITALWGRARDEVYASAVDGVVHRYDGVGWAPEFRNTGAAPRLHGLWGTADELYVVGDSYYYGASGDGDDKETGWHYNIWRRSAGSLWFDVDTGIVSSTPLPELHAVWSDGPGNVYVAGHDGVVLHFNGTYWTQVRSYTQRDLAAVWGAARTAFFGGENGTMLQFYRAEWRAERPAERQP